MDDTPGNVIELTDPSTSVLHRHMLPSVESTIQTPSPEYGKQAATPSLARHRFYVNGDDDDNANDEANDEGIDEEANDAGNDDEDSDKTHHNGGNNGQPVAKAVGTSLVRHGFDAEIKGDQQNERPQPINTATMMATSLVRHRVDKDTKIANTHKVAEKPIKSSSSGNDPALLHRHTLKATAIPPVRDAFVQPVSVKQAATLIRHDQHYLDRRRAPAPDQKVAYETDPRRTPAPDRKVTLETKPSHRNSAPFSDPTTILHRHVITSGQITQVHHGSSKQASLTLSRRNPAPLSFQHAFESRVLRVATGTTGKPARKVGIPVNANRSAATKSFSTHSHPQRQRQRQRQQQQQTPSLPLSRVVRPTYHTVLVDKKGHTTVSPIMIRRTPPARHIVLPNPSADLSYTFPKGRSAKSVKLLPDGQTVEKRYDLKVAYQKDCFDREVAIMQHLSKLECPFVPKLLRSDTQQGILWMTFCGPIAPTGAETSKQVQRLVHVLGLEYGVERNGSRPVHWTNVTVKNNQLYLIDFGTRNWKLV